MDNSFEPADYGGASFHQVNNSAAHNEQSQSNCLTDLVGMTPYTAAGRADDVSVDLPSRHPEGGRNDVFLALISHELRNALGAIHGAASILSIRTAGAAAVKAHAVIDRQIVQMKRLVEDLMDVSQVRSGRLRLRRERIDLGIVAAHAVQSVEFTMQQRHHRMITSVPNGPMWFYGDSARLEQVIVNLLLNAAKCTDAGGQIELLVEQRGGEAFVCIRDTGIGMTAEMLPHVFDLFVQAEPACGRAHTGLGIGLALVRSLVEGHGGSVTAASAGLRHGSTFTVRLPKTAE